MSARCKPPVSLPPIGQGDHSSVLWSFNNGTTKHGCSKVKIIDRVIIIIKERLAIGLLVLIGVICSVLIHVTTS